MKNKEGYYPTLRRTQISLAENTPDWNPWLLFFLRELQTQKARLQAKIDREGLMEGALPELSLRILEMTWERGQVKSGDIVAVTSEAKSTVRNRLNELVGRGLLIRHEQGPATWYTLG